MPGPKDGPMKESTEQLCCYIGSRAENHAEICNPCQALTLFGWPVPLWLEWAGMIGFALVVLFLISGVVWYWPGTDDCLAALHLRAKVEKKRRVAIAADARGDQQTAQKARDQIARIQRKWSLY